MCSACRPTVFTAWGSIAIANKRTDSACRTVFNSQVYGYQTVTTFGICNGIFMCSACRPTVFAAWGSIAIANNRANGSC